jgi:hypothetical protein
MAMTSARVARSFSPLPASISTLAKPDSRTAIPRAARVDADTAIGNALLAKREAALDTAEARLALRNVLLVRGRAELRQA